MLLPEAWWRGDGRSEGDGQAIALWIKGGRRGDSGLWLTRLDGAIALWRQPDGGTMAAAVWFCWGTAWRRATVTDGAIAV